MFCSECEFEHFIRLPHVGSRTNEPVEYFCMREVCELWASKYKGYLPDMQQMEQSKILYSARSY